MSIRNQFWLILLVTITISVFISLSSYGNKEKLTLIAKRTTLLDKRNTILTSFMLASRQSLFDMTEFIYTRKESRKTEFERSSVSAERLIQELRILTVEAKDDTSSVDELAVLHVDFIDKSKVAISYPPSPSFLKENKNREMIVRYYQLDFLPKILTHRDEIHRKLEAELEIYESSSVNTAAMTMTLTGALSLFVVVVFTFVTNSIVKRLNSLNHLINSFELSGSAFTNTTNTTNTTNNDEISKLIKSFNELTRRVYRSEKLLAENQRQMIATSKMASLGEMSAGIAHEIRNPLAIIDGETNLLKRNANNPEKLDDKISTILASCSRISTIINGLLKYSRSGEKSIFKTLSLARIAQEALLLTAVKAREHNTPIDLEIRSASLINCNEVEIEQVFINLINNAVDAVKNNNVKWIKVIIFEDPSNVVFQVTDSGTGITENIEAKLFDPFFTTKRVGEGTGLGLSISKGILDEHGASISILKNVPNTCFEIRFPKIE